MEEEINYNNMRYELDEDGYIYQVYFGCASGTCQSYEGEVPDGYSDLQEWYEENCTTINAWKIVDGNLTLDTAKEANLQAIHEQESVDNSYVTHKELNAIKIEQDENLKELYDEQSIENSTFNRLNTLINGANLNVEKVDIRTESSISEDFKMFFTSGNMLPNEMTNKTINGLTFSVNDDKSINISGTSTSEVEVSLAGTSTNTEVLFSFVKDVLYYLSGLDDDITLKFYHYDGTDRTLVTAYTGTSSITWVIDKSVTEITIYIPSGKTIDTTIYPMLQQNGETIKEYEAYKGNVLDVNLGDNAFNIGDNIIVENGEITLIKDRFIHVGSNFVPDYDVPNYTTLYFNFPDDLYKTLPIEKTDIFMCSDGATGIYVEDKKIYFITSKSSGERLDVTIYDNENDINLSSCSTYTLWASDEVYDVISVTDSEVINYISLVPFEELVEISLGSVNMPSTYSTITNVYSNKDVVSKITYRNSSKLNTNKIILGTFEVNENGLKSKLTPPNQIANYDYDYTQEDLTKLAKYTVEGTGLTYTEKLLYDLNGDGVLNAVDTAIMRKIIATGMTHINPGTLEINGNSLGETIVIKDGEGKNRANIHPLGIDAVDFFLIDEDGNKTNVKELIDATREGTILVSGTNLNDIITPGIYKGYEVSANSYTNVPVKTGTFILEVFETPDGVIGQRYTQCRENNTNTSNVSQGTFMRFYTSNWSRWQGNASAVTYDTNENYGWYRIFRASYLGGYANTSAIITIKSGSLYPHHLNGSIRFTQYHTSAPAVQIIEGNITPSKVKVILNSDDKTFDVFVKITATYTSLDIFYQTSSHNAVEINPEYFGTEDTLPTASSTYSVRPPENYYRSGETLVIDGYTALPGLLTTSSKNVHFTIFTPKDMSYINSITINSYSLDIRHPSGGYIANDVTSFDGIVATKRSPNMIDITITYNTAVSFTNNTPVSVAVNNLKLTFN